MYLSHEQKAQIILDAVIKTVNDQTTIGNASLSDEEKKKIVKKAITDALQLIETAEHFAGFGI